MAWLTPLSTAVFIVGLLLCAFVLCVLPAVTYCLRKQDEWFDEDAPRPGSTNAADPEATRA